MRATAPSRAEAGWPGVTVVELIRDYLPLWALPWLQAIGVGLQILLIVAGAWGLRRMLRRLVQRLVHATRCRWSFWCR